VYAVKILKLRSRYKHDFDLSLVEGEANADFLSRQVLLNCFNQVVNLTNQNYVFEAATMVFLQHQILIKADKLGQVKHLIPINFLLPTRAKDFEQDLSLEDHRSY
jgi:hypothetical protein